MTTPALVSPPLRLRLRSELLPGVMVAATGAVTGLAVSTWVPVASPLLVAVVWGLLLANSGALPASVAPGLAWAARRLLRAGIVLLGLQVSFREVAALGPGTLALVVGVVVVGVSAGVLIGRLLGVSPTQRVLIACGFSICGAAAVAAADGAIGADEEETATAVALVVAFGSAMMVLLPALAHLLGLSDHVSGIWAGASIQEVAQVVAAGGIVGGNALTTAVVVKLARVLLLAPVLVWIGWQRRLSAVAGTVERLPPLVPLFVVGFCVLAAVHTWVPVPPSALDLAKQAETGLLAAAMCALGCAVRWDALRRIGARPVVLAAALTTLVAGLGLAGAVTIG